MLMTESLGIVLLTGVGIIAIITLSLIFIKIMLDTVKVSNNKKL